MRRAMTVSSGTAAGLSLVLMLVSCGDTGSAGRTITIAFSPKSTSNPVFGPAIDGARVRARELTEAGPHRVEILIAAPEAQDAMMQSDIITAGAAAGEFDALAISCTSAADQIAAVDAVAATVPVIAWDSDCTGSARDAFYSLDNTAAGRLAARLLARQIGDSGQVAILVDNQTGNLGARVAGFQAELAASHPGITVARIVECGAPAQDHLCPTLLEAAMTDFPDLRGWFFASTWMRILARGSTRPDLPEPIPPATQWQAESMAGTIHTVAIDSLPEALPFVRDGRIDALIGQRYWGWGYDTVDLLYEMLIDGTAPPAFIDSGTDVVCANNVEQYASSWTSNDFSLALPDCALLDEL